MAHSIRLFLFLAISSLITSCASKETERRQKQADLQMGAGTQALVERNYTDALNALLKANELKPNDSEILNNLGMAYYFKGSTDIALKHLSQSLKVNPDNSDAKINIGSIYYAEGKIVESEKMFLAVLKDLTYTKQARTYYNLGMIELLQRKNLAKAQHYFQKSVTEDENYCSGHFQLGFVLFKKGNFNKAYQSFKDSTLGVCNKSVVGHYYQGLALVEMRRYEDARLKFTEIDSQFKTSSYAIEARRRMQEISRMGNAPTLQAAEKYLSPEF